MGSPAGLRITKERHRMWMTLREVWGANALWDPLRQSRPPTRYPDASPKLMTTEPMNQITPMPISIREKKIAS